MPLPLHKRYEIIFLHYHSKGPKLGLGATAKIVGCSKSSALYWVKKWGETKNLNDEPKPGRNRITTPRQDAKILKLASDKENVTAVEIQQEMGKRNVSVSVRTIQKRLREGGAKYMAKLSKPLLTEKHKEKRLKWAKDHQDFDWDQVIFTDESTFHLNQPHPRTWQWSGRRKLWRSVKHPLKLNVWGCFSSSGFGKLIYFQHNLNAKYMVKIYEQGLLPSAELLFGADSDSWILQEDNDSKHCATLSKNWKEENNVKVLPWPSVSPDQNPIKNVWRLLKIKIAKKKLELLQD